MNAGIFGAWRQVRDLYDAVPLKRVGEVWKLLLTGGVHLHGTGQHSSQLTVLTFPSALHSSEGLPFNSALLPALEFGRAIAAVDCDGFVGMCSCMPRLHSTFL